MLLTIVYTWVGWPSLFSRRLRVWHIMYKTILGILPTSPQTYIHGNSSEGYCLRCQRLFLLAVPKVQPEMVRKGI